MQVAYCPSRAQRCVKLNHVASEGHFARNVTSLFQLSHSRSQFSANYKPVIHHLTWKGTLLCGTMNKPLAVSGCSLYTPESSSSCRMKT